MFHSVKTKLMLRIIEKCHHDNLVVTGATVLMETLLLRYISDALHWRHNDHDGVSNHQPHGCLLNRLFRRRSKKTSKLRVTGLCVGNSPGPVNSPHKGPVTRKMFPFDDVIMGRCFLCKWIVRIIVYAWWRIHASVNITGLMKNCHQVIT